MSVDYRRGDEERGTERDLIDSIYKIYFTVKISCTIEVIRKLIILLYFGHYQRIKVASVSNNDIIAYPNRFCNVTEWIHGSNSCC